MYGALIRQTRAERGLTQTQLAAIAGVKQSNISSIENGRRAPTAETLHRLLFACGFELVASAGPRQIALPPPARFFEDDGAVGELQSADEVPIETKARMLVAALDASEAVVRSH